MQISVRKYGDVINAYTCEPEEVGNERMLALIREHGQDNVLIEGRPIGEMFDASTTGKKVSKQKKSTKDEGGANE